MNARPNFFIVGAPKCGTTAMAQYLADHPRVFVSPVKEPHYFATDFSDIRYTSDENTYLELFGKANDGHQAVGEASVSYLYSVAAQQGILDFAPDAKIVVMLRNPVELVYSWHGQMLKTLNEDITDFATAWDAQSARADGQRLPEHCLAPAFLQYRNVGMLGHHTRDLLTRFAPEQVHLLFLEDLRADADGTWERLEAFLSVDHHPREAYERVNEHSAHRNQGLARWFEKTLQGPLGRGARSIRNALGLRNLAVASWFRRMNTSGESRTPLSDEFRQQLIREFAADIDDLAALAGRDLDHWKV